MIGNGNGNEEGRLKIRSYSKYDLTKSKSSIMNGFRLNIYRQVMFEI